MISSAHRPRYIPYEGESPFAGMPDSLQSMPKPEIQLSHLPDPGEGVPGLECIGHVKTLRAVGDTATLNAIAGGIKTPDARNALVRAGFSDRERSRELGRPYISADELWQGMRRAARFALDEQNQTETPRTNLPYENATRPNVVHDGASPMAKRPEAAGIGPRRRNTNVAHHRRPLFSRRKSGGGRHRANA